MSTDNNDTTSAWEKVAEDTESLMMTIVGDSPVEVAFQTTDVAPSEIIGHRMLPNRDGLIRSSGGSNCPPGFVYIRTATGSTASTVAIDTWTE